MRIARFAASVSVGGVLLCAALAGCGQGTGGDVAVRPSAPGPSLDLPAPSPRSTCPAGGVRVTAGPVDGAMGLRAVTIRLTNCGSAPYTVSGYPVVGVADVDGDVALQVNHGFPPTDPAIDHPPATFVLAPGQAADAGVTWGLRVEASGTRSVTAPLVVTPGPGQARQQAGVDVDLGTTRELTVGAWYRPDL